MSRSMAIISVPIFLLVCMFILAGPITRGVKSETKMPSSGLCRRGAGETCRQGSMMNCCKTGLECKTTIAPGSNANGTAPAKCCLGKDSKCTKIGAGSCCQGYSCEASPSDGGLKCQQFLAESST